MISMVPLVILVPMARAWKKEVFSGPSPVFCLGSVTLMGAMAPALAAAGTCRGRQSRGKREAMSSFVFCEYTLECLVSGKSTPTCSIHWGSMHGSVQKEGSMDAFSQLDVQSASWRPPTVLIITNPQMLTGGPVQKGQVIRIV